MCQPDKHETKSSGLGSDASWPEIGRMPLRLIPASKSRKDGEWSAEDYDVFDGDKEVGRIYRINDPVEKWFWGFAFGITNPAKYGRVIGKREDAMAAFKKAYEAERAT